MEAGAASTDDPQSPVQVTRATGTVRVVLNRPARRNALDDETVALLTGVFRDSAHRENDRVLVLSGAGGAFCAGADLSDPWDPREHLSHRMRRVNDMIRALHAIPIPTIALIDGPAVGAGCNLALCCDLTIATPDARFSEIFTRRGLSIDAGGSWLLPRLIGLHRAKELALLAPMLTAQEAHEIGLCNRVLDRDDAEQLVEQWAQRLADLPPVALTQTKRLLNAGAHASLDDALEAEALAQVSSFASVDAKEAIDAFHQKREPHFTGQNSLPPLFE